MRRDVFQAIADPVRREILDLLAHQTLNLNSVAENFDISRPAISKHIKILNECGLVIIEKQGRERFCTIQPKKLTEVASWVEKHRELWEAKLDSLEEYLEKLKEERNTTKE
jgi:DNA-binding transcriptional ArsR family regulator